jgi:flagellar motor switch/type III secretory pathway protein FliN
MSSSPSSSSSSSAAAPPEDARGATGARPFAGLHDVMCPVSVILGTGVISVRACLALTRNSVVRLRQSAGEDLQVVVGRVPIARGEVVIVEDSTAIRLTEMLPPAPGGGR